MATEFAVSRFLIPAIAKGGWALFMDCDVLVRGNVEALFRQCREDKAVMVVKHHYDPPAGVKMDGQEQTRYARKNWSSVMAINCSHPANRALTVEYVNAVPGRDLHRFAWLDDDLIGDLDPAWNYLVGHHNRETIPDPQIVHFTEGFPLMNGYENCDYSDEWSAEFQKWAMSS